MAAALHLGLAIHNFGIQEHMPHNQETDEVFPHAYRFDDGTCFRETSPASASISMRSSLQSIRTNGRTCPSYANSMEPCGIGKIGD